MEQSHRRPRLRAVAATHSPAAFLARPTGKLHPLSRMIQERGMSVAEAAKHLGVDRAALERVVTWRAPAVEPMRSRVATALGLAAEDLFPPVPVTRESFE